MLNTNASDRDDPLTVEVLRSSRQLLFMAMSLESHLQAARNVSSGRSTEQLAEMFSQCDLSAFHDDVCQQF